MQAEELIASALADAQGKQQVGQSNMGMRTSRSPTSEAAVDDLLMREDADDPPSSSPPMPIRPLETDTKVADSPNNLASSSTSVSTDRTAALEQMRQLILPVIIQNIRLRDPNADVQQVTNRVMSLMTDEQCMQFMNLATQAKSQMEGKRGDGMFGAAGMAQLGRLFGGGQANDEVRGRADGGEEKSRNSSGVGTVQQVTKEVSEVQDVTMRSGREARAETGEQNFRATVNATLLGAKRPREPGGEEGTSRPSKTIREPSSRASVASSNGRNSPQRASSSSRPDGEPPRAPKAMRERTAKFQVDHIRKTNSPIDLTTSETVVTPRWTSRVATEPLSAGSSTVLGSSAYISASSSQDVSIAHLKVEPTVERLPSRALSDMEIDTDTFPSPAMVSSPPCLADEPPADLRSIAQRPSSPLAAQVASMESDDIRSSPPAVAHTTTVSAPSPPVLSLDRSAAEQALSPAPTREDLSGLHTRPTDAVTTPLSSAAIADSQPRSIVVTPLASRQYTKDSGISLSPPPAASAKLSDEGVPLDHPHTFQTAPVLENIRHAEAAKGVSAHELGAPALDQDVHTSQSGSRDHENERVQSQDPSRSDGPGDQRRADAGMVRTMQVDLVESATPAQTQPESSLPEARARRQVPSPEPLEKDHPMEDQLPNSTSGATDDVVEQNVEPTPTSQALKSPSLRAQAPQPDVPVDADTSNVPARETPAPFRIPGICFAEVGKPSPQVHKISFHIDQDVAAAASRWSKRQSAFEYVTCYDRSSLVARSHEPQSYCLACHLPSSVSPSQRGGRSHRTESVRIARRGRRNPALSADAMASAWTAHRTGESRVRIAWRLVPAANGKTLHFVSFYTLLTSVAQGPDDGPLDLTPHIIPGDNTLRLIQLSGLPDRIFVLYAGTPSPEEQKPYITNEDWERWASAVQPPLHTATDN